MTPKQLTLALVCLAASCLSPLASGQDASPKMPWQRNLSDALAISKRTGKPLLLCVNMNGEVACERIAARRYHDPKFIALVSKFVPVLASPTRHNERDYDEHGHRIPCPKFGKITCSEHINIEPGLHERYFSGRRVAPRHIGIDTKGEQLFDLFLLRRLSIIDETLASHGKDIGLHEVKYDGLGLQALLGLHDHEARVRVEAAYANGDAKLHAELAAKSAGGEVENPEILRMALSDKTPAVRQAAMRALAKTSSEDLLALFVPAIADCNSAELRASMLTALGRIAKNAPASAAAQQHKFLTGVYTASTVLDGAAWQKSLAEDAGESDRVTADDDLDTLDTELNRLGEELKKAPKNADLLLGLAKGNLRYGRVLALQGSDPTFLFGDARGASKQLLKINPKSVEAAAYIAQVAYLLSEENAAELTTAVVAKLAPSTKSAIAATTLKTFAKLRTRDLYAALGSAGEWPSSWISDIHSSYQVLARHAAGTEDEVAAHAALLAYLEAYGEEAKVIAAGLDRFPSSTKIHQSLRTRLLRIGGAERLEAEYQTLLQATPRSADLHWFAGYASIVAAELRVGKSENKQAIASYGRCVQSFAKSYELKPSYQSSATHFSCLALAGRGRLHLEAKRFELATKDLCEAARQNPGSVDWKDGLGKTPRATARLLRRTLTDGEHAALAEELVQVWESQSISLEDGR